MKPPPFADVPLELPEQYELRAAPRYRFALSRRRFLQRLGGGALVLALVGPGALRAQRRPHAGAREPDVLEAWLHLAPDGTITFFSGKAEVGQNVRTSLAQVVAEELPAPLAQIHLVLGDTDLVPWDAGTFGSRTMPHMAPVLRRAAAAARMALIERAAAGWSVPAVELSAQDGQVVHERSGRRIGYGELVRERPLVRTIDRSTTVRSPASWQVAGTSPPKADGASFVTGAHRFSSDIVRPGLVYGRVLRPPTLQARLRRLDSRRAAARAGVSVVHDGDFAGVTARTPHEAAAALADLQPEWQAAPMVDDDGLFAHLRPGFAALSLAAPSWQGDLLYHQSTYTVDYIAHAPLEPRAAVAEWQDGRMTVWTGTQRPFGVRTEIAEALRLNEADVRVIVPDTGSAYGGKHTGDAAVEAARLAHAVGAPVKLVWTREEEFNWAYARPAGVMEIISRTQRDGTLTAWRHDNWNSGGAGLATPYATPAPETHFHRADSPLRQGSYRALAATANHFARETHIDEIAVALEMDALTFRRRNLTDPRLQAVLSAAVERFGWNGGRPSQAGRGVGVALGMEKGSVVATCAEVEVGNGAGAAVRVLRVVQAFECGAIIHPRHLRGQNVGCIIQGLGGALFERLRFRDGRLLNPRFSDYRLPRFSDLPEIEIVLLDRRDQPSAGGSETPIVGIAPAIGNAIHAATGRRLRALPLAPHGLAHG